MGHRVLGVVWLAVGLVAIQLVLVVPQAALAQGAPGEPADFRSDYPADCSPDEAKVIYQRSLRKLRAEQRAAIKRLVEQLEREIQSSQPAEPSDDTPQMRAAAQKWLGALQTVDDSETGVQLTFLYRPRLSLRSQRSALAIVEEFSALAAETRRLKLAYQPYLAENLRREWEALELPEKRDMLGAYLALGGDSPDWSLHLGKNAPPMARSTADAFESFERRTKDELYAAEKSFQPQRDALLARVQAALRADEVTKAERQSLIGLQTLLEADYSKGLRGLMLIEPGADLPARLRDEVAAFCKAHQAEVARLQANRAMELAALEEVLAPVRQSHLKNGQFAELMLIDIRLQELEQVLRPLRILARRAPGVTWPEEVLLLDVRDQRYRVRFMRDEHEAWLPRSQVLLKPSTITIRDELAVPTPATGPGRPVTEQTALYEGQTLMAYRNNTWYPVNVVDLSPFGVVISWQGFRESSVQFEPRSRLRTLSD